MTQEVQEVDAKDLKILAYKEKVSELEERIIDLRVEVTYLSQELETYKLNEAAQDAETEKDDE